MKKLFIATMLAVLGTGVFAETPDVTIEDCNKMDTNNPKFRDCVQQALLGMQKSLLKSPVLTEGGKTIDDDAPGDQWIVQTETRALTGEPNVYISTMSTNVASDIIGSAERGRLLVRCHNGDTDLIIFYNEYFSRKERIKFRVDDGPIFAEEMLPSADGKSMGMWGDMKALPMIRKILGKDEVNLELSAHSQTVPLTFDVSGLANVIAPLTEACNWKP